MWWKAIMAASGAARLLGAPLRRHLSGSPPSPPAVPRRFVALWGNGDHGRLGLGALGSRWRPALCPFFADESDLPLYIACGGAHTLVLTEKGHVYATGINNFGQLGITTDTEDGELYMWGKNSNGQLGLGRKAESIISAPTRVDCLVGACIKMVALGSEHSIALTDDGNVLSWGAGQCGRLGHGPRSGFLGFSGSSSEYSPRLIKNFEDVKVKRVAAGLLHSACIVERGSLFIFGEKTTDKLGFGETKNTSIPSIVHELPFSEQVACGGYHTCVITSDGQLYTWGSNENGCLGLGLTDMVDTPKLVESTNMKFPVSEVSCGWKHTAAIAGGNLLTWGWGGANGTFFEDGLSSGGQLGHGTDLDSFEPIFVNIGKNIRALQVSCGFNHTGAIFELTCG